MDNSIRLKPDHRRKKILEFLARDGQVKVAALSKFLNATPVTIRADLSALEKDGRLRRVTGGAVQTAHNFFNTGFPGRKEDNPEYKMAVAKAVAAEIENGETLFINAGTTTLFVAIELKQKKHLNIVTNSMAVAVELSAIPTFRVIMLGGEVNPQYTFSYGSDALDYLSRYKAEKSILSVDGVSQSAGLTTYHAEEAKLCAMMMARSSFSIIAADYSKFGRESFSQIAPVTEADLFVTNPCANQETTEAIRCLGKNLIFAE